MDSDSDAVSLVESDPDSDWDTRRLAIGEGMATGILQASSYIFMWSTSKQFACSRRLGGVPCYVDMPACHANAVLIWYCNNDYIQYSMLSTGQNLNEKFFDTAVTRLLQQYLTCNDSLYVHSCQAKC